MPSLKNVTIFFLSRIILKFSEFSFWFKLILKSFWTILSRHCSRIKVRLWIFLFFQKNFWAVFDHFRQKKINLLLEQVLKKKSWFWLDFKKNHDFAPIFKDKNKICIFFFKNTTNNATVYKNEIFSSNIFQIFYSNIQLLIMFKRMHC